MSINIQEVMFWYIGQLENFNSISLYTKDTTCCCCCWKVFAICNISTVLLNEIDFYGFLIWSFDFYFIMYIKFCCTVISSIYTDWLVSLLCSIMCMYVRDARNIRSGFYSHTILFKESASCNSYSIFIGAWEQNL